MKKTKTTVKESGRMKNSKPSRCAQEDAAPLKLSATVDKTSKCAWFSCLIGVSLSSLITRLYNLHLPASVWLVCRS